MKMDLLKGIVLIGAVVLSSCSSTSKLAGLKNTANDDDVYYTKAKAGDRNEYIADVPQQNNSNYNGDDDYYYYGDYASRLNRFANYTPFDYSDNFYYTYVPYNNGFGAGLEDNTDYYSYHYGSSGASVALPDNGYVYSPYDYGYSPYYDMGYDNFGYGNIYSAYILSGGGGYGGGGYGHSWRKHGSNTGVITTVSTPGSRGVRTTPSPGVTRLTTYPGNPLININRAAGVTTRTNNLGVNNNNNNNNNARQTRESFRPVQQQQSIAPPPSSSNSSSSSSSSSSTSSGGGGRPVRP